MLTKAQLSMFHLFGFVVLREVFGPDDMEAANSDFEMGLRVAETAMERTGIRGQLNWSNLRPETPFLASLLEDERLLGPASQILGQETIGSFSNCNSFDGDRTEWHPDVSGQDWHGVKFGFYLQPLDAFSGALRLIPGSHREPLHSGMRGIELSESFEDGERAAGLSVQEVPAFVADSTPGDVVAFDNRTWHASYGGFRGRRMCTAGYFAAPSTPAQHEATERQAESEADLRRNWPLVRRGGDWLANADGSATRQRWIDALNRYGFVDDDES